MGREEQTAARKGTTIRSPAREQRGQSGGSSTRRGQPSEGSAGAGRLYLVCSVLVQCLRLAAMASAGHSVWVTEEPPELRTMEIAGRGEHIRDEAPQSFLMQLINEIIIV